MITKATIEKILDATRIEEVVGDFVNLRRRGVNMLGLCPFHQEKTPSFTVSPGKNLFKCFGCGRGGDAIGFLKEHENFSYPEALRYLASKYQIEIEETVERRVDDPEEILKDQLSVAAQYARDFFGKQLWETDEGKSIGLSYFKQRGFREAIIRKFDLGYAPQNGSSLSIHAVQEGFRPEILQQAGLINHQNRDFFRDRVMFTIHSLSGKPVAFAGRIMGKVQGPKYINSPETAIYHKSNVLYGLFFARQAIRKEDSCILVEGYTDVLSLAQEGIDNVVASSGTALTIEQIRLIKRFTNNLTILYDGDAAGLNAALRGLELVLEQDMNVRIVVLPPGQDPDSFLTSQGREAFLKYVEVNNQDFILFKTHMLLDESKADPIAKAKLIREIVGSIAKVPDQLKRAQYTKVCAERLAVSEAMLIQEINKLLAQTLEKDKKNIPTSTQEGETFATPDDDSQRKSGEHLVSAEFAQELDIVRILVTGGDKKIQVGEMLIGVADYLLNQLDEDIIQEIAAPAIREFLLVIKAAHLNNQVISSDFFLHHEVDTVREFAMQFMQPEYHYSDNWEKRWNIVLHNQPLPDLNFARDAQLALFRFHLKKLDNMCKTNAQQIKEAYEAKDDVKLEHYLKFQQELQRMRNQVAQQELNTIIIK